MLAEQHGAPVQTIFGTIKGQKQINRFRYAWQGRTSSSSAALTALSAMAALSPAQKRRFFEDGFIVLK